MRIVDLASHITPLTSRGSSRKCRARLLAGRWIVVAVFATACASPAPQQSAQVRQGPTGTLLRYEGPVVVSGAGGTAFTTVYVDGRGAVGVVGALEPEVRTLMGARVRIEGPAGTGFPGEAVDVRSYAVLEVNGQRPYVGVLVSTPQGLVLEPTPFERDRLPLATYPGGLSDSVGAKVWVTGTLNAGRIDVQSFGIIRPQALGLIRPR